MTALIFWQHALSVPRPRIIAATPVTVTQPTHQPCLWHNLWKKPSVVNPTGSQSPNTSGSLPLQAISTETLQYLGSRVGAVIEARVVQVLTEVTSSAPGNASRSVTTDGKVTLATPNDPARAVASSDKNTSANPAERYQLLLSIDNTTTLKVSSQLAPRMGQVLQMMVLDNQQLRILDPRAASKVAANTSAVNAQAGLAAAAPQTAASPSTAAVQVTNNISPNDLAQANRITQSQPPGINAILQQALRSSLPKQASRAQLPLTLAQLANNTPTASSAASPSASTPTDSTTGKTNMQTAAQTGLGTGSMKLTPPSGGLSQPLNSAGSLSAGNNALLQSAEIEAARQILNAIIPTFKSTVTPTGIRDALLNSGAFYEHKLAIAATNMRARQSAQSNSAETNRAQTATTALPSTLLQIDPQQRNAITLPLQSDMKHGLLQVAKALQALLPNIPMSISPTKKDNSAQSDSSLVNLWQTLGSSSSSSQSSGDNQRGGADSVVQLLRLALGATARTQTQQILAVGSQLAGQGDPQINQSLNVELPLWLDQRLSMVEIKLEREKAARRAREKIDTWNVRLRFDLEDLGELTALATLQGKRMAAVLWSSQTQLTEKIQAELAEVTNQLNQLGLNVKHLHCRTGHPPAATDGKAVNILQMNLLDTQS